MQRISGKNLIRIIAVLFGLLILGITVYALIPRAKITFAVAPQDVVVFINDKEHSIKNGQSVTVSPGKYEVRITQDEFDEYKETIEVKNGENKEILTALNPQTAAARKLLASEENQKIIQRVGGRAVEQGSAELMAKYPIMKDLPINAKYYTIVMCNSNEHPVDSGELAVCVRLSDLHAREIALKDITDRGYLLSDYEIIVEDYTYEALRERAGE